VEDIVTGEAVVLDLPCARFPTRMLARLIDIFVQIPLLVLVTYLAIVGSLNGILDGASAPAVFLTGYVLVLVGYPTAFETLSRGRTLGKLALGLRVVGDDGGPERFRQALVRALSGAVECWALAGVPALIASLLSSRGKRLGDMFAGTFVVRERAPRAAVLPGPGVDPVLAGWAGALDLSGLPEELAASAASYLSRYWQLHQPARDQLGWQLASDVSSRVAPPPPPGVPPVVYLATVMGERRNREIVRLNGEASGFPAGSVPAASSGPPSSAPGGFVPPQ